MTYKQVMIYAVRKSFGHDIVEGSWVEVITDDLNFIGVLQDAGTTRITVSNPDGEEYEIEYNEIKSIREI